MAFINDPDTQKEYNAAMKLFEQRSSWDISKIVSLKNECIIHSLKQGAFVPASY
jgi:hypothetical protein